MLGALKFLAEAEREVNEHEHKADRHDRAGIFDEVEECVAERGADDDVRRVAAHRGRAAEVRAENFRQDHRHGVEFHRLRQFERDGTTVMLSMNIDKNAESDIKQMSSGTVR